MLLDEAEHAGHVEASVAQVHVEHRVDPEFPIALLLSDVDAGCVELPQMFVAKRRVNDLAGPIASLEPILDKRHHDAVFLLGGAEEGADVAVFAQCRTCDFHANLFALTGRQSYEAGEA